MPEVAVSGTETEILETNARSDDLIGERVGRLELGGC